MSKCYPFSSPQREIWFDQVLHPGVPLYNIGGYVQINGAIDPVLFESAVNLLVKRHDALRTVLVKGTDEIPMQVFLEDLPVTVPLLDFPGENHPCPSALAWMQEQFVQPFDLYKKPLFHFALLKIDDHCFYWFEKYHHLIVDGWGISLITRSLAEIYTQLSGGPDTGFIQREKIQHAAPSYSVFIEDDRTYIESQRYEANRQYWLEKYRTLPEPLFAPRYLRRFADRIPPGERGVLWLSRPFYNRLLDFAKNTRSTLFHVMLGALYVYFTRTGPREELAIGLPLLNRGNAAFKETVGLFIGVCAARFRFETTLSFRQLLMAIGNTLKSDYHHHRLPIGELNRALGIREKGREQLFDIRLNYAKHDHDTEFGGFKAKTIALTNDSEQTPLTISVWELHKNENVQVDFVYNLTYFDALEIERIQSRFMLILEYVVDHVDESIGTIPLLTEAEHQQLLDWNRTKTDYPGDQTLVDLFQAQVEKTPDHIAVVFEGQALSYRELNTKANQLAHYLMALGVGSETLVCICAERSLKMVISLLGILKAGGAYVPMDPDYPLSRLQFMLEDTSAPVLLSQSHLLERLPVSTVETVDLDSRWEPVTAGPGENPLRQSGPGNPAYVIYTSGSTGKPKGVQVCHSALLNFLASMSRQPGLTAADRLLSVTTLSFDIAGLELYLPLLGGAKIVIVGRETASDGLQLLEKLESEAITIMQATPATWHLLTAAHWKGTAQLKILCGGEALPGELARELLERGKTLWNLYGPTETTIWSTVSQVLNPTITGKISIGRPIANTQIYILDTHHHLTPPGIPGELCIAGAGLARGYLNRPELTAEKFCLRQPGGRFLKKLPPWTPRKNFLLNKYMPEGRLSTNHHSTNHHSPLTIYHTGDLARWLPDGNLEFLGRLDHQVKLRGFRIELSEIEVILSQHQAVKEAVVVLYREDNPYLVAYVTLDIPIDDAAGVLRSWLKNRLPEYMLPAGLTVLDKLPLTPNGKIDRKALPAPDRFFQVEQLPPRTETERLLCGLWSQVLGIEVTSIHSHFFAAGGHSLLATRLVSRIRESFGIEMPLRVVFDRALLREQAEWLDKQQRGSKLPPIMPLAEGTPLVLSFAQERLWFLAQLEGQNAAYNMAAALHMEGHPDETALQRALTALIQRHDSLRLSFPAVHGEATVQLNDVYNPLSVTDLGELPEIEKQRQVKGWITNHAQTPFDLGSGPLLNLHLLKLGKQEQVLLFNIHHIISDGWSMGVLIREWSLLYNAHCNNVRVQNLEPLPIQYTDYAAWQRNWLQGEILEKQLAYWTDKLKGAPGVLELPTDFPRPPVMSYKGNHLQSTLDQELTKGIKQLSRQQGVTDFMTLLAVFKVLLYRYSGQTDLVVGSPIANRTHHQTEDLIGLFVNTLVLRTQIHGEKTSRELLEQVRQTALDAYTHQDIPFEYLVEQVNPSRSLSHSPLFQVMFVLQNAPEESLEFSGLKLSFLEPGQTIAKFDLTLSAAEKNGEFVCDWEYCTDLFRPGTISRMAEHFQVLLGGILNNLEQPLSRLPLLTEAEQQQLLAWSQTGSDYPGDQTIVDLFHAQVEKTPGHIAVVFEEEALSYRELNTRANRLTYYLMTLGVGAETLVGLCAERSLNVLIGLLGILKAGGVYVPLDPGYPLSRLQFMLEDSAAAVLLSQNHLLGRLPVSMAKVVDLAILWEQIGGGAGENPVRQSRPWNPAYVIYTSGSTGKPKGVIVGHAEISQHVKYCILRYRIESSDNVMQFASLNFDASLEQILSTWYGGARLVLLRTNLLQAKAIQNVIAKEQITIADLPSAYWQQLLQELNKQDLESLELLILGGEALASELARQTRRVLPNRITLLNAYGPTEAVITSTLFEITEEFQEFRNNNRGEVTPIGQPIANTQIYILDTYHNPTPPGIPGELCISGARLARGYLNRPELTAEKFCLRHPGGALFEKTAPPNPPHKNFLLNKYMPEGHLSTTHHSTNHHSTTHHSPLTIYKTGDLARWLLDGNIEFLARLDHQIKLHGFRIELGEVETTLSRHEAVKESAVTIYEKGDNPRLVAYITLDTPLDDAAGVLRSWLKTRLPEYMLPASFMVLDRLPLTPNGKIDRKALPAPDWSIQVEQQVPGTETERLLCSIWSQVLGIEITSILSHFFTAGGHSLLATRLVSRIRESFGIEMPLRMVFEQAILREQAEWLDTQQRGSKLPPIIPLAEGTPLVLSFAQQRLWFLAQLEGQSAAYNMAAALHLEGHPDETALQSALTALIQRHDSLRQCFPVKDGKAAVQFIDVYNPLSITDISELSETEQQHRVREWIDRHAQTPFDLGTGPLLSLRLLKLGKDEQVLLFNMHHIIGDGWSMGVLIREWSLLYNAHCNNVGVQNLEPLPIQYTDYAAWQRNWLQGEILEKQLAYWTDKLKGAPGLLEIPTDYPRPAVMSYRGKHLQSTLDQEFTQGIKQLSRQEGVTAFMTLLAVFKVLLYRYSGQTDLVVGSPIANRTHHQTEDLIGFFVNTLVLRTQIHGEQTSRELLKQVRQTALEAYSHQDIPFEYLVEKVNPSRSLGHSPLFQAMFVLQNTPGESLELSGIKMSFLEPEYTTAKFYLTLSIVEQDGVFVCDWEYCTDLFRPGTIARMAEHFRVLLGGILDNVEQSLQHLPLLTEAEKQQLLDWNQTGSDYPEDLTIVDLFQVQEEKTPDQIAVVFEEQALSYRELNTRANRLAHYLMALGVEAETLVGICVQRSLEMAIGLLGILKAGGTYLPLDPDYPLSRLQFMLEDSGAAVLLSQRHLPERLPVSRAKAVGLENEWKKIAGYPGENPLRQSGPGNSAYVIYTSGSTGKPKGVLVGHAAIAQHIHYSTRRYRIEPNDNVMQFASLNFDASLEQILSTWYGGARLILLRTNLLQGKDLQNIIAKEQITVANLPPTYWHQLLQEVNKRYLETLKLLILGGDALSSLLAQQTRQTLPGNITLLNAYGPTEAAITSTLFEITEEFREFRDNNRGEVTPIGQPIANTQIYILDTHHNPTPPGIPGELCISGAGLARGYLNRPELTAEKFCLRRPGTFLKKGSWTSKNFLLNKYMPEGHLSTTHHSTTHHSPLTIYRTGDRARWLPDGNIEFLGRLDHQIKLHGFRIELGEVETTLSRHEAVKESAVAIYEKGDNPRLVAYITLDTPLDDAAGVLRSWLKTRLPEYMLPASFMVLDRLPLTPNGKIDRKALPAPDWSIQVEQQVPGTETERLLCSIWSQVLGIEITSILSHFFTAGGHSLLATRLVSRIRESFGIEMPLRVVFERALLREQAEWLDTQQRGTGLPPIMPLAEGTPLVLSFAQQRLWFLAQLEGQSAAYNMAAALHLEGHPDETALQSALTALIQRHDSLRQCFPVKDGKAAVQFIDAYNPLSITDLSELSETEQQHQVREWIDRHAQTPFDLGTGPLLSLRLLKLGKPGQVLLFNMHHIIGDGWSMGVLIREWSLLYNAHCNNVRVQNLEPLPIQYTDYAAWQRNWLQGEILEKQLAYWTDKLKGAPELLELPTDYPRPAIMSYRGKHLQSTLDQELTKGIKQLSRQEGVTAFMTLLAVFKVLLYRYTGQTDLVVGSPIANRTHLQTEDLIGFFVNTLVLRTQLHGEQTSRELLKQVRQTALEGYSHQDIPFEYLVEKVNPSRSLGHSPLFQAMFILQNAPGESLELSGLQVSFLEAENTATKFDLTLSLTEQGDIFVCDWEYCTDLFRPGTIARMAEHFQVLLRGILDNVEQSLQRLPLLTEAEKQQLLDWNQTGSDYPEDLTIVDLFQVQEEKTSDHIAVVFGEQALGYSELNTKANRLAHYLMTLGVGAETLVGIYVERSLEMLTALLGTLKAGGAYVPLDPDYPLSRLQFMLEDSSVPVLLSRNHLLERLPVSTAKVVSLDNQWEQIRGVPGENPVRQSGPGNPAYMIYTSGSTGKPKGVMIEHGPVINLLSALHRRYPLQVKDTYLLKTSYLFDVSVTELLGWFPEGGRLAILEPGREKDPKAILDIIAREGVTHINFVPSMFQAFVEILDFLEIAKLSSLKYIFLAGEALPAGPVNRFRRLNTAIAIENIYGPTEAAVYASWFSLGDWKGEGSIPIGMPLPNIKLYILDKPGYLQPIGVPGELCIGGVGLARGYLNNPGLTAEKFWLRHPGGALFEKTAPPNPPHKNFLLNKYRPEGHLLLRAKIYQTGDLAKWLTDGNIEFLGRLDFQVKVRGFRIELGEIENRLLGYPGIKAAVVLDKTDESGDIYLSAYLESDRDKPGSGLREYLEKFLPGYMIPAYFTRLEKMPVTAAGKIDRKALPNPVIKMGGAYEAPRDGIEKKLVEIWSGVLGIEEKRIGINDNFFHRGGHSLKAILLVSRIYKELKVNMPLSEVFKTSHIRGLAVYISNAERQRFFSIEAVEKKEYYILSSAQKRLLVLQQMDKRGTAYNMPSVWELEGELNIEKFETVFRGLVRRHESLRTSFRMVNDGPVQVVHDDVEFETADFTDYTDKKKENKEGQSKAFAGVQGAVFSKRAPWPPEAIIKEFIRPFDLTRAPLFRVGVIGIEKQKNILMVDMHHIISDGMSMGILVREFMELYAGKRLAVLRLQYKDYSQWQTRQPVEKPFKQQESYWINEFSGEIPVLELSTDYPRPPVQDFAGRCIFFEIGGEETGALKSLVDEQGVTLFMLLLSLYMVCLSRLSGQEDIVVGTPAVGRRHVDLEPIMGMFVNTLALRSFPDGQKPFIRFLEEVKENTVKAFENQDYLFENLVEKLDLERDTGRNPLFDAMFSMQDFNALRIKIPGLKVQPIDYEARISKFDMTLTAEERGNNLLFILEYSTGLFKEETIRRFMGYFTKTVSTIIENRDIRISGVEIIGEEEKNRVLYEFNDTAADYPIEKTIHRLFEERVEKGCDITAVIYVDSHLTYDALNKSGNCLGIKLREKGVRLESIVGIMTDRSLEMVVSVLGVLKAGGAYILFDPGWPKERIKFILKDTGTRWLLKKGKYIYGLGFSGEVFNLNDVVWDRGEMGNMKEIDKPDDPAYVSYAQGRAGISGGTLMNHKSALNMLFNLNETYRTDGFGVHLFKGNPMFYGVVVELFGWIIDSGRLVILHSGSEGDGKTIVGVVKKYGVTHLHLESYHLKSLLQAINSEKNGPPLRGLRYIGVTGDTFPVNLAMNVKELASQWPLEFENIYGTAEIGINAAAYSMESFNSSEMQRVPIGKPLKNISCYVMDKVKNFQPVGVVGELYIGGVGLARGYLNNPERSREKFVHYKVRVESKTKPPALIDNHETLFRTGDLGRWMGDGNIEFLEKIDRQVKIRGMRVELGVIRAHLLGIPGIKEVQVVPREDAKGKKFLCVYIVGAEDCERMPDWVELRVYLSRMLPGSMIPLHFIEIKDIPLDNRGKPDIGALPVPGLEEAVELTAPGDDLERKLVEIWSELLQIEKEAIGIDSNFFKLGGHSFSAAIMISKIEDRLHAGVNVAEVFKGPTVRELARYIRGSDRYRYVSIESLEKKEYYPLSSAQKRLFILDQVGGNIGTAYNLPGVFLIEGELSKQYFVEVFHKLIKRHETLRTSFHMMEGEPVQRIHKYDGVEFDIEYFHAEKEFKEGNESGGGTRYLLEKEGEESGSESLRLPLEVENAARNFVRPFDLSRMPLMRAGLIKINEEKHLFIYDMHHIISDGVSMGILVRDFFHIYEKEEDKLPGLKIQYKDFSQWQNQWFASGKMKNQEIYWLSRMRGEIPVLELPTDYPHPPVQNFAGDTIFFNIDNRLTGKIKEILAAANTTMYIGLLTVFYILLAKYAEKDDIIVGMPIAGRTHGDTEEVIGFFVNTLAIRNYPREEKTFMEFLSEVKESAVDAYKNQDYPFEELVNKLGIPPGFSRNPLIDVLFVSANVGIPQIKAKGLKFLPLKFNIDTSHMDLALFMKADDTIDMMLVYSTALFNKSTAEKIPGHYQEILGQVAGNSRLKLKEIKLSQEYRAAQSKIRQLGMSDFGF